MSHIKAWLASAAIVTLLASPALADTPKWGAHLDFEGRLGSSRSIGDAGLFAPLWQSQSTLFFTDIRGKFDSQDGREGNFGLGIRHMLNTGWNLGAYGYYDRRRTSIGNHFEQVTLGVEALSADWDLRANFYAPFGSTSREIGFSGGRNPFAEFVSGTIQIVTPGRNQIIERAMGGFDGEIGWRAPVFDVEALTQVRLYGGGYYFSGDGVTRDVAGPRGRVEFSIDDLAGFSSARLTLGAEVQHDDVRGTQGFAVARLRVPLHADRPAARLSAQERRMTERVVRDVDIVSGTGGGAQNSAEVREAAVNTWNNQKVTTVVQVTPANQAALQAALNAHGAGSVVIVNGELVGVTTMTDVGANKTLIGGGTVLALRGASTGTAVNFLAPGASGSLTGAVSLGVVELRAGSVVGGLTVGNTSTVSNDSGIYANNAVGASAFGNTVTTAGEDSHGVVFFSSANATASGNTVTATGDYGRGISFLFSSNSRASGNTVMTTGLGAHGIDFSNSHNATASGNTITTTGLIAHGVNVFDATQATVSNNVFGTIGSDVIYAGFGSNFLAGSDGNRVTGHVGGIRCNGHGNASGTVTFTDGVNCHY